MSIKPYVAAQQDRADHGDSLDKTHPKRKPNKTDILFIFFPFR